MLRILVRKEIVSHILSLRFTVTFTLFIVLVFSSMYVMVSNYKQDEAEYYARARASQDHLNNILSEEDQDRVWGRLFRDEGRDCEVPVAALSWLGQGLQPAQPAAVNLKGRNTRSVDRGLTRNPLLGLFHVPDFVYVVNTALSLLAILFMFDAVCGEKEAGTLRLVLSNSVPRHQVLLGKWIGGYIVLVIPFLVSVAGGLIFAWARGVLEPNADTAIRVLALTGIACLYIAAFFNLGLFISTTTKRPATSLLVCLLVWVTCIVVIPNLGPVAARILKPTPSRKGIEAAKQAVDREINLRSQRLTLTSGELSYGDKIQRQREELDDERNRRKRELDRYFRRSQKEQLDLARTLGRASPSASWVYSAVALAGTGPDAFESFRTGRESAAKRFTEYYRGMREQANRTGWRNRPKVILDEIPSFRASFPDMAHAVTAALNDILVLAILNVVFFMLAFTFFLRYDVR